MRAVQAKTDFEADAETASVSELPSPTPWRRYVRRFRARPLGDPFGLAVMAFTFSLLMSASGIWLLGHLPGAAPAALSLGAMLAVSFLALVARAARRDKTIQYWIDRRDLRRHLTRERAHRAFLVSTLNRIHELEQSGQDTPRETQVVLASLVAEVYGAFAASYDDIAVVLALEADGRHKILHSALSPGSRWKGLRPGKNCHADRPLEETLDNLAEHHYTASSRTASGELRIAVLADVELSERDEELVNQSRVCLDLIVSRWGVPSPSSELDAAHA